MSKLKVLVTEATGYIVGLLLPVFRGRYDLRLLDIREQNRYGQQVEGVHVADLLTASADELAKLFQDVDVVVRKNIRSRTTFMAGQKQPTNLLVFSMRAAAWDASWR